MSEEKKHGDDELSIGTSLVLIAIFLPILLGLLWFQGCFESRPARNPDPEIARRMEELDQRLKDPRVSACFQVAMEMGEKFRREGRRKPSDSELHALALQACEYAKIPADMRGVAVEKFKSGFGWGWSRGP
jgi:hypothetical protein